MSNNSPRESIYQRARQRARTFINRREEVERIANEASEIFANPPEAQPKRPQVTDVTISPKGVHPVMFRWGLAAWSIIGLALVVFGIAYIVGALQWVLVGIFAALVLTSLLSPIVNGLSKIMPRALATAISIIGFFVSFGGIITWIVGSVANQWDTLSNQFSAGVDGIFEWIVNGPIPVNLTVSDLRQGLQDVIDRVTNYLQTNAGSLATSALSQASSVLLMLTIVTLALFCSVFFMAAGEKMWLWAVNQVPARHRRRLHAAATAGWYSFSGYARGTIIIAVLDGVMAAILLMIVKVPLAAPLAVLVTIGAFIPLFGAPLAMGAAAIVALATQGPTTALIVLLGVALIGQFEGHILQPLIMGHQVSLHPVVIAVGVTAGTFVAGLLGAIVVIPLISICWEVYKVLRPTPDRAYQELPVLDLRDLAGTAVARELVDNERDVLDHEAEEEPSALAARAVSSWGARRAFDPESPDSPSLSEDTDDDGEKDSPSVENPRPHLDETTRDDIRD